jgi:hypothetical protein
MQATETPSIINNLVYKASVPYSKYRMVPHHLRVRPSPSTICITSIYQLHYLFTATVGAFQQLHIEALGMNADSIKVGISNSMLGMMLTI